MMRPEWVRGKTRPEAVGLALREIVEHMDHICEVAGNARHCGIGSDLDGAFGKEQCPADVETIADLARIPELLRERGYSSEDIEGVAHRNFVGFLRRHWK
jgi:membrane dipeptidase